MADWAGEGHKHKGELHGITIVVDTEGPIVVGRCHEESEEQIMLLNVDAYEPGEDGPTKEEWVKKAAMFGITPTQPQLWVKRNDILSIRKLGDLLSLT